MTLSLPHSLTPDVQLVNWMTAIRRHIHMYPEISFNEFHTADFICQKLDELSIPYRNNIAQTGIIATIGESKKTSQAVALRADMDALPIQEKTGLAFSSKNDGVMHACGHDGHVAMLLGAASLLQKQPELPGRVVLLFQPAEEDQGGAEKMIEAGALDGVSSIFAGHIDRHFQVGEIAVQAGLICAFTDEFKIVIRGQGGHAAKPHETIDCIVVAGLLIMSLQTLVSRETNPAFPSVVTVGKIAGGSAVNVIADQAVLEGTIRTTHPESREKVITGLERMVLAMEDLYNADTEIRITPGYPPVINDQTAVEIARKAASDTVGHSAVKKQPHPSLGGEDFSFYLKKVPGCLARFGAKRNDLPNIAAHSPRFDFHEGVLPYGAEYLARCAFTALANASTRK